MTPKAKRLVQQVMPLRCLLLLQQVMPLRRLQLLQLLLLPLLPQQLQRQRRWLGL